MTVDNQQEVHFSSFDKKVIAWVSGIGATLIVAFTVAIITVIISLNASQQVTNQRLVEMERRGVAQSAKHNELQSMVLDDSRTVVRIEGTLNALNETLREFRTELRTRNPQ